MTKVRPLWLWLSILLLIIILVVVTLKKTEEVHDHAQLPKHTTEYSLYVPSPYELGIINSEKDIWPRRFGPKQPPETSDLPAIYSVYVRRHPLQREEVDFFRSVAVSASLGEWNAMRDTLNYKIGFKSPAFTSDQLLQWAKKENCTPFGLEIAYRLFQWDSEKLLPVKNIFQACDAQSFHTLWFELLLVLQTKDKQKIANIRETLQKRRQFMPNESFEFFILTQAFESLDMQLAHGAR